MSESDEGSPLDAAKIILIIVWVFAASGFVPPASLWTSAQLARPLFGILAVTHAIEFFLFMSTFKKTGEPLLNHFFSTMAFGVIHYTEVKQRVER